MVNSPTQISKVQPGWFWRIKCKQSFENSRLSSDLPSHDTLFGGLLAMRALFVSLSFPPTPVRFFPSLPPYQSLMQSFAEGCKSMPA